MPAKTTSYMVTLYLRGSTLDPAVVSDALGITPSRSHRKGERRTTPTAHKYQTKTGLWTFEVVSTSSLSAAIRNLVAQLTGFSMSISKIEGVDEAFVDIYVSTNARDDGGGTCELEMSSRDAKALAALNLPVQITVALVRP